MKKSRAETSGALSGEFADRVRPPYASDEKRRQAAELFAHGIGYQRASRILDLPANTLRDWARAWRAGKLRTTISPHLYRYSDAVKRKAVRMRQKGHTWHEIAEATGVGASTCKRWMEKLPKSEKVETEWDRQRKKTKQLKALQKKMNERKKEFIRTIADGKIELLKDEERQKIIEKMIRNMMEKSCWLGNGMVLKFFTGKSLYDADEKEKEEAEEKIQTLDTQVLLLIAMNNMIDDYTGDLVEYSGEYKEDAGKRYQECFKILMRYGWSYEREEADLVYGNHELYKKES